MRRRNRYSTQYYGLIIAEQSDGRFDVFENKESQAEDRPIAENFNTVSLAKEFIDREIS